jgi:hypothetical protein
MQLASRAAALLPRETQETISQWGRETFSTFAGARNRVVAVLEEAVELVHAEGLSREEILRTVQVPLDKQEARGEAGDPEEEAADVDITLRAYAFEKDFQLHEATDKKMAVNRLRPRDHFVTKTEAKVRAGLPKYEAVIQSTYPTLCSCHTL